MAAASPNPISLPVAPQRWYPNFPNSSDRDTQNVYDAITRLYDLLYQQQQQIQVLAAYLNKNP
ncbi:MAG TPA: hypothetical protein VN976_21865 [Verrucomicrobiae bacterium]|nr:hypothetical protein [Verrucomicrobiae bacterium]